jgi:hypothetical protein
MKKNIFRVLLMLMAIASFNACQKDEENDPVTPGVNERDKFLGTWITTSTGTTPTISFTMTITAGASSPSQLLIRNFENEGNSTTTIAQISANDISIPNQLINSDSIQGSGTYNSNNTLSLHYTLKDGQTVDTRTATAHK